MAQTNKKIFFVRDKEKDLERCNKLRHIHAHAVMRKRKKASAPGKIGTRMQDGTIYAGWSPRTKRPMYAAPADETVWMTFQEARQYAENFSKIMRKAYRVPSDSELNVLFNHRAAIGGFNVSGFNPEGIYLSSTPDRVLQWVHGQNFKDGFQSGIARDSQWAVRLVRS